jgi:hypothetical protein
MYVCVYRANERGWIVTSVVLFIDNKRISPLGLSPTANPLVWIFDPCTMRSRERERERK